MSLRLPPCFFRGHPRGRSNVSSTSTFRPMKGENRHSPDPASPLKKGCITVFWIPGQVGNDVPTGFPVRAGNDEENRHTRPTSCHTREGGYPTEPDVFQQAATLDGKFSTVKTFRVVEFGFPQAYGKRCREHGLQRRPFGLFIQQPNGSVKCLQEYPSKKFSFHGSSS